MNMRLHQMSGTSEKPLSWLVLAHLRKVAIIAFLFERYKHKNHFTVLFQFLLTFQNFKMTIQ